MNLLLLQVFQKVTSVWRAVCPYRTAAGSKEPVLVVPGTLPLQSIKKTQPNKTTCALKKKKGFLLFHLVLTGVPCQFCEEVERNWSQDTDLIPWWEQCSSVRVLLMLLVLQVASSDAWTQQLDASYNAREGSLTKSQASDLQSLYFRF